MPYWEDATTTVCVDLNGVLDTYCGFTGKPYPVRPGAKEFLMELKKLGFRVVILSSLLPDEVYSWLKETKLYGYVDSITSTKVPAIVYLDDRGITFDGDFQHALEAIKHFRCHWEDENHVETPRRNYDDSV